MAWKSIVLRSPQKCNTRLDAIFFLNSRLKNCESSLTKARNRPNVTSLHAKVTTATRVMGKKDLKKIRSMRGGLSTAIMNDHMRIIHESQGVKATEKSAN
jgi:hypothetical protein